MIDHPNAGWRRASKRHHCGGGRGLVDEHHSGGGQTCPVLAASAAVRGPRPLFLLRALQGAVMLITRGSDLWERVDALLYWSLVHAALNQVSDWPIRTTNARYFSL
jgi:hypothetical protein